MFVHLYNVSPHVVCKRTFGMFEHSLIEHMEAGIKERVLKEFDTLDQDLFKARINDFLNSVNKDICVGVLSIAQNNGILKH
jgi:hypothetical protein